MPKLLLTSVGSLVGQALLDCLDDRRSGWTVVGTNLLATPAGLYRCDRVHLAPPANDAERWIDFHAQLAAADAFDLVVPCRDDDVLLLARWKARGGPQADRLLAGPQALAQALVDKADYAAWARTQGVPFAPTVLGGEDNAVGAAGALLQAHGVLVAKPRRGHGSLGVRLLSTAAQVEAAANDPTLVLQPGLDLHPAWTTLRAQQAAAPTLGLPLWAEVPETTLYGVQALIDPQGRVDGHFAYRATQVAGRPAGAVPWPDADLEALGLQHANALAAAGWRGPCNVQAKRDEQAGWHVIEVNGRFTGLTHARRRLGFDEVGRTLRQWVGPGALPEDRPVRQDGHVDGAHWVADDDVRRLAQTGVWTAA